MNRVGRAQLSALCLSVALGIGSSALAQLDAVIETESIGNDEAARSQVKLNEISDEADALISRFRVVSQRIESLRVYNGQIEGLIASQQQEMTSLQRQIDDVTLIEREIMPLMLRMIGSLDQFVSLDVPFLLEERRGRIGFLRDLMDRADVSVAEKYRRVMEAWQVENEYGRTIEDYSGELEIDGAARTVEFLRIGRVALIYQTLDGERSGAWDRRAADWVDLGTGYRGAIRRGLRMARKQSAPDLLRLPIPAATDGARSEARGE
jgi:hypothetical protein